MNILDPDIEYNSRQKLLKHIRSWHTDSFIPLISEWAAENRYLPPGTTEYPGMYDNTITPYLVQIMNDLHPSSDYEMVSIMKGTQTGATTGVIENSVGHSIKYKLHNILSVITSQDMAKMRSSAAIDVMIDNSNLKDCMKPMSNRIKRKVADSTWYKEMHGNRRMLMTSYNSITGAKSFNWSLVILDELDEAPGGDFKGQGDIEAIFKGRTKTIRGFKIIKISTPTNTQGRIYKNFMEGDQQYYYVRCPLCGEYQVLKILYGGADYGLTARAETIDNISLIIPDSVKYICKFCKKDLYEHQKGDMLNAGKWIATAKAINPRYRSYHISNLMSPVVFYSWRQCMQEFAETDFGQNILKFKNFRIDVEGWPWESKSEKKDWQELKSRAENYQLGSVPDGFPVVVAGIDTQKNRLEMQVVAYGKGMKTAVIDYIQFFGDTYDRNNKVWRDCKEFLITKRYKYKGITVPITLIAIDSGYNPGAEESENSVRAEHVVYDFVAENYTRMIACRGNPKLKDMIIKEERVKRASPLKIRYDVAVNELKDEIFVKVDLPPDADGAMHFSKYLSDQYFQGFLSEVFAEVEPGKWGWKKIFERNEPLDTWILCRAAAEKLNLPRWPEKTWDDYELRILAPRQQ